MVGILANVSIILWYTYTANYGGRFLTNIAPFYSMGVKQVGFLQFIYLQLEFIYENMYNQCTGLFSFGTKIANIYQPKTEGFEDIKWSWSVEKTLAGHRSGFPVDFAIRDAVLEYYNKYLVLRV